MGRLRRRAHLAAALLTLALIGACTSAVGGGAVGGRPGTVPSTVNTTAESTAETTADGTVAGTPSTTAETSGTLPAGLEQFYAQQLGWGPCGEFAPPGGDAEVFATTALECANLVVPLSYDDPAGQPISIGVLRRVANDADRRIGSVVFNPGGPGVSGIELVANLSHLAADPDDPADPRSGQIAAGVRTLNERFDLVGFDPRGVGSSRPQIECRTDAERDEQRAAPVRTRTQPEVDAANARARQIAENCAARTGVDEGIDGVTFLANIATSDVARDLDVLRAVLGDDRLTFVGLSYGTSIGGDYAEMFPGDVRALLLDGAVARVADPQAESLAQLEGFQKAFDDFAAWCVQQETCVFGSDPANAVPIYQTLVRPLLDVPLTLPDGRVLSYDDARTGTFQALYADAYWPILATALLNLAEGDGSILMLLADYYEGRADDGRYSTTLDAFLAISCTDGEDETPEDPAAADEFAAKLAAAAPIADKGDPPRGISTPCDYWPAPVDTGPPAAPHEADLAGLPQTLVISTTGDPATPYQAGVDLAGALGARLLTVDGTNHTAYLGIGNKCVDDYAARYLIDLELPPEGATCA